MDNSVNHAQRDSNKPEPKETMSTDSLTSLWQMRSKDDVAYQRQAQVTWWTLMGGIAFGALLTQFESLLMETRSGNWQYFLYFFATCFVLINSWIQTAWGALVLRWPLSVTSALILFFGNLSCSIAALSITNPSRWYGSISSVVLFSIMMQYHFKGQQAWITLPEDAVERASLGISIYFGLMLFALATMAVLYFFSTRILELLFGALAVIISAFALWWQHLGMEKEKSSLHLG